MMNKRDMEWSLGEILDGITVVPQDLSEITVMGLSVDSRTLCHGDLFIALAGSGLDGVDYIDQAVERGAVAILFDSGTITHHVGIQVANLRQVLGQIASRFYGNPSHKLKVVAVTGTDGKSSVTHFIAAAMERFEGGAAVIGTLGGRLMERGRDTIATGHTTPPPIELQRLFSGFVESGVKSVAIEASSHGIEQFRLSGSEITSAVLTQVGRDHLDYHGSVAAYRKIKKSLFYYPGLSSVVVNLDDELGREIYLDPTRTAECIGYGSESGNIKPDVYGAVIIQDRNGMVLEIEYHGEKKVLGSNLYGRFNASNLLATLALLISWKVPFSEAVEILEKTEPVSGRMEPFVGDGYATMIIDYAHTPGALAAALTATREHLQDVSGVGRLWVLFGCGGDRDSGKRPEMGRIAEQYADVVVLTDDNPRGESAVDITRQILAGMQQAERAAVIHDREEAIRHCFSESNQNDIVLIAGKGHEEWQLVGERKIPFSDRLLAASLMRSNLSGM